MIIDLIRHTKPAIEEGICYGQTDLSLAESFDQEYAQIRSKICDRYDYVISSPLLRCHRLAERIVDGSNIAVELDDRIMEYNFGDWEMLPWSEFKDDASRSWMDNFVDQPAPNGDSMLSMQKRVTEFWDTITSRESYSDSHIAVITHSGVQRLLHAMILETPLSHMFRLQLSFGAVIRINFDTVSQLTTIQHL